MLIETVKRWTIIILLIVITLLVLVMMAMRVDAQSMQSKNDVLAQQNQTLMTVATDNAKQVKQLITDNKANDVLSDHRQQGKTTARDQTRRNTYVVHQSLSSESCSTMQLPASTISVLKHSSDNTNRDALPATAKGADP